MIPITIGDLKIHSDFIKGIKPIGLLSSTSTFSENSKYLYINFQILTNLGIIEFCMKYILTDNRRVTILKEINNSNLLKHSKTFSIITNTLLTIFNKQYLELINAFDCNFINDQTVFFENKYKHLTTVSITKYLLK